MLFIAYVIFAYSATCLLECWKAEGGGSYGTLAKKALGKRGMHIVRLSLVLQQCGVVLTYFIFIATNVQQVTRARELRLWRETCARVRARVNAAHHTPCTRCCPNASDCISTSLCSCSCSSSYRCPPNNGRASRDVPGLMRTRLITGAARLDP